MSLWPQRIYSNSLSSGAVLFCCHSTLCALQPKMTFFFFHRVSCLHTHRQFLGTRSIRRMKKTTQVCRPLAMKITNQGATSNPFPFPEHNAVCLTPACCSTCLISALESLSGRTERLCSPSVFSVVRDLHSHGWALRSRVLLPHTAPAFCYPPPAGAVWVFETDIANTFSWSLCQLRRHCFISMHCINHWHAHIMHIHQESPTGNSNPLGLQIRKSAAEWYLILWSLIFKCSYLSAGWLQWGSRLSVWVGLCERHEDLRDTSSFTASVPVRSSWDHNTEGESWEMCSTEGIN